MPPEFTFAILLGLGIVALPIVVLALIVAVLRRQGRDHDDLSYRLGRIEREVE